MESWHIVCERLAKALHKLRPDRIELLEVDSRILTIMVVSAKYVGMRNITRFRLTDKEIMLADERLYAEFMFIYECWTPSEFGSFSVNRGKLIPPVPLEGTQG